MDSIVASNRRPAPRLARPAERYWKGKLPKGVDVAQGESESEEESQERDTDDLVQDIPLRAVGSNEEEDEISRQEITSRAKMKQKSISVALKDVKVSSEGRVTVAGRSESGRTKEEGMCDGRVCFCLTVSCLKSPRWRRKLEVLKRCALIYLLLLWGSASYLVW